MTRGYFAVGLQYAKCRENVGGVLRASACYGATFVAVSGSRFGKSPTDTTKAWRHTPLIETEDLLGLRPHQCDVVAVEICADAVSLIDFVHPSRAFYVFGLCKHKL